MLKKLFFHANKISSARIRHILKKKGLKSRVIVFKSIDSTNSYAKIIAASGAPNGTIVAADTQTAGRGRLGKDFFSPSGTGVYMSVIVRRDSTACDMSLLTIAACVAVCWVIEKYTHQTAAVKWVNDIFLNGKKVCGILTEAATAADTSDMDYAIVGIGLNVSTPSCKFPGKLQYTAGSINVGDVSRNQITADIYESLSRLCEKNDTDHIIDEYRKRSLVIGKTVRFTSGGNEISALAIDINRQGNLVIKLENGQLMTLKSGEISLGSSNFVG